MINEGQLAELGTHEELMALENGQYRRLYEMQFKTQPTADTVDEPEEESFPPEESPSAPGIRQETSPPEAEPPEKKICCPAWSKKPAISSEIFRPVRPERVSLSPLKLTSSEGRC